DEANPSPSSSPIANWRSCGATGPDSSTPTEHSFESTRFKTSVLKTISFKSLGRKVLAVRSLCDSAVSLGYQHCVVACLEGTKPGDHQTAREAWTRMRNRGPGLARTDVWLPPAPPR